MTVVRRSRRFAFVTVAATLALLAFFVFANSPALPAPIQPANSSLLTATIAFDGVSVAPGSHNTISSAIVTNFSGAFSTAFTWNPTGTGGLTVTQVEIQLLFFGTAIGTSSASFLRLGESNYTLSSDFTQNRYIYEGVYDIVATIQDNGTTLYSQSFFVWIQATDHLTILNVVLILLLILEVYEVAALGRMKIPKQPAAPTPSTTAPSTGPSTTSPPSPGGQASTPSDYTPPAGSVDDGTPPSGGT